MFCNNNNNNSCITVLGHYTVFDTSLSLHISDITEVTKYEPCQGDPNLLREFQIAIYLTNLKEYILSM